MNRKLCLPLILLMALLLSSCGVTKSTEEKTLLDPVTQEHGTITVTRGDYAPVVVKDAFVVPKIVSISLDKAGTVEEIPFVSGEEVKKGDIIAEIRGKTRTLLKGERTALNLLQHMSGVATATRQAVKAIEGTNASIADTRKTLPGLRPLQKYAVTVGGGKNHRYNLSDAAMLKDNHVDAGGGIASAVAKLRQKLGHMTKIELEVRSLDELGQALEAGVDVIMLDNMSCEEMREAVAITNGRALLEASGGITAETLRAIAETGVDIISMGALTHSVTAFDISLKISC